MKKLFSLLGILLLVAVLSGTSFATDTSKVYTDNGYRYTLLEDGTAKIIEYYGKQISLHKK